MMAIKKPRNARSKRAMDKRLPQLSEPVKSALIVNASHSSALVSQALHQLGAMKKPNAISFSKKKSNDIKPFVETSSIEFLSVKNDCPLVLFGDSRKKRKDNLTWIRLFDGRILDMLEMGIENMKGVEEFKPSSRADIGARPMFHFAGPQFAPDAAESYPAHAQLKSVLLDFYRGEELLDNGIPTGGKVAMQGGLQYVISVTAGSVNEKANGSSSTSQGPTLADLYASGAASSSLGASTSTATVDASATGSKIYFRAYSIAVPAKTPVRAIPNAFQLEECGPAFDFTLRRRQPSDPTLLSQSLRRAKTQAEKNRQGKSDNYKKNIETDEMGDMVGRVHVGKQDLSNLQTRKMKGLRGAKDSDDDDELSGSDFEGADDDDDEEEDEFMGLNDSEGDEEDDDEEEEVFGDTDSEEEVEDEPAQVVKANGKKRGRKA